MPAAYTGPIPYLSHPARVWIRPSLALRARVRWNAAQLDAALARGAAPGASKALALRAQQLADPKHRTRIARSIHRLLSLAQRSGAVQISNTGAPFRPDRVEHSRPQLMELAGRLETLESPPAKGLAMANLLVEDGSGALYAQESSDPVRPAVDAVLTALQS
jgi:hypothetical protein